MSSVEIAPEKSRWAISHYILVSIVASILFCLASVALNKRLVTGDINDGFFAQIQFVAFALETNTFDPAAEPLHIVHIVRLALIYPWFLTWLFGLPSVVDAILLLPLLYNVLAIRFRKNRPLVNFLIFLLPLAFSFRTIFVIVGIANLYAYFYSDNRQSWRLYLSALLAFLSSGVTLAWLVVGVANYRRIIKHRFAFIVSLLILAASLAASILQKITFFNERPPNAGESTGLMAAIQRNTIFVSYNTENKARFLLYCGILAIVVWFLVTIYRTGPKGRPLLLFFLTAAISFVFEGLGPIAFFMPVAWVLTNNIVLNDAEADPTPQTA